MHAFPNFMAMNVYIVKYTLNLLTTPEPLAENTEFSHLDSPEYFLI